MPRSITLRELQAQGPFLRRLALALVGDGAEADDLVQDTWAQALEREPEPAETVRGWLGRLARNRARSARRGEARRRRREALAGAAETTAPRERRTAVAEAVLKAVLELAPAHKRVLLQRYYEDRTPTEIAARDGLPLRTVETRLRRARIEMRQRLDDAFGERANWSGTLLLLTAPARISLGTLVAGGLCMLGLGAGGYALGARGEAELVPAVRPVDVASLERASLEGPRGAPLARPPARAEVEIVEDAAGAPDPTPKPAPPPRRGPATVHGTVGPLGLTGAWVAAVSPEDPNDPKRGPVVLGEAKVDELGRYRLWVRDVDELVWVVAVADDREPAMEAHRLAAGSDLAQHFLLAGFGAYAGGEVRDEEGRVPHAEVHLIRGVTEWIQGGHLLRRERQRAVRAEVRVQCGPDGRFEVYGLEPGPHLAPVSPGRDFRLIPAALLVDHGGAQRVVLPDSTLVLRSELEEIHLQVGDADGTLSGVIAYHGQGREVRRAVSKRAYGGLTSTHLTQEGRLRVLLEPGTKQTLVLVREGYEPEIFDPRARRSLRDGGPRTEGSYRILLQPSPTAHVSIGIRAGGEVPGVWVLQLVPADPKMPWPFPVERVLVGERELEARDIPVGRYQYLLRGDGSALVPATGWVKVTARGPNRFVASFQEMGSLAVVPDLETPVGSLMATCRPAKDPESGTLTLRPRFPVPVHFGPEQPLALRPGLAPGRWEVSLRRDGEVLWEGKVKVSGGKVARLKVEVPGEEPSAEDAPPTTPGPAKVDALGDDP